jgi:aminoglycoside phosphotransferase (APT) family kinase protein
VPVRGSERNLDVTRDSLEAWLRARHGQAARIVGCERASTGFSSESLFVDVDGLDIDENTTGSWVIRLPGATGIFADHRLEMQATLQAALAAVTPIPVAPPIHLERDPNWLGVPFLVMAHIQGRNTGDNPGHDWLAGCSAREQSQLFDQFVAVLAAIHRLSWSRTDLAVVTRPEGPGTAAELAWWTGYASWASDGQPTPALQDGLAWCNAHQPAPEPPLSLLWGDARLGNVIWDDQLRPAAVLDWEMAATGPAEIDLAYFLLLHQLSSAPLPGFPATRHDIVANYEAHLGRPVADLDWYEAFACLRVMAINVRIAALLAAGGEGSDWLAINQVFASRLDQLIA